MSNSNGYFIDIAKIKKKTYLLSFFTFLIFIFFFKIWVVKHFGLSTLVAAPSPKISKEQEEEDLGQASYESSKGSFSSCTLGKKASRRAFVRSAAIAALQSKHHFTWQCANKKSIQMEGRNKKRRNQCCLGQKKKKEI